MRLWRVFFLLASLLFFALPYSPVIARGSMRGFAAILVMSTSTVSVREAWDH